MVAARSPSPTAASSLRRARVRVGGAGELERHRDVLQRRHGRDEVERLEHDPDIVSAKARERVLVEAPGRWPATMHRAGVGALQPGHDHQQRRFARARRADQADRLAGAYMQVDVLEDMDPRRAAAERQVDAGERDRRACQSDEVSFMWLLRCAGDSRRRSYGKLRRRSRHCARGCGICCALAAHCCLAAAARRSRRSASWCSATRSAPGFGLPVEDALPGKARARAQGEGDRGRDRQCRRLGRHRGGRARAARLVGAGRHRRRDPRTRRQRRAARHRSEGDARGARRDHPPAEGAPHRGAARRHAGAAQSRPGLRRRIRTDLPGTRGRARPLLYPFILEGVAGDARSISPTASIRPPPAST